MTLEEKIAHLQTTSMEQARLEGNVIIDTHQAALEKVFEGLQKGDKAFSMEHITALRQDSQRLASRRKLPMRNSH